jgi:hypothetical protein
VVVVVKRKVAEPLRIELPMLLVCYSIPYSTGYAKRKRANKKQRKRQKGTAKNPNPG